MEVSLKKYKKQNHSKKSNLVVYLWLIFSTIFFRTSFPWPIFLKIFILKLFGSKLGKGVVIKPKVTIKYPWKLAIANYVWIGENVWIDNLESVHIGSNVCISQGAMLLTGNHNYKSINFDLMMDKIILEDGVWIGAKAIVCPGIVCKKNCILNVGSVLQTKTIENGIYQGNPAQFKRKRF